MAVSLRQHPSCASLRIAGVGCLFLIFCFVCLHTPLAIAQEPQRLTGHAAAVNSVVYTPDGAYLISASADQTITIRLAATGKEVRTLRGHTAQVLSLTAGPDNRSIISGSSDNTLKLWDIPQPDPFYSTAISQAPLSRVVLSPNGETAVGVGEDRLVHLLNAETGAIVESLKGHSAEITKAAFRNDNQEFATADATGHLLLWRTFDSRQLASIGAHQGGVRALQFHPNNQQIFTAGDDGLLKTWQLPFTPPKVLADSPGAIHEALISTNGQFVLTAGEGGVPRVYAAATGELTRELESDPRAFFALALSPNDAIAAAGDENGLLQFWNVADGADRSKIEAHAGPVRAAVFHTDNLRVATAGDDGLIRLWALPTPRVALPGHTAPITSTAIAPNNQIAATGSTDKSVRLWNPADGQALRTLAGHEAPLAATAFRGDNTQLATLDQQGVLRLWNPADGVSQGVLGAHPLAGTSVAYHPANDRLATADEAGSVKLWKLPLVAPRALAGHTMPVNAVAINSDGTIVLTGGADKGVRLFNGTTGAALRALAGPTEASASVALSADAALSASGDASGVVSLWNTADGADRLQLRGHIGPVHGLAFPPQGDKIATAGADGTIRVWRLPTPALPLAGHTAAVSKAVATADGKLIITASADKTLRVYNSADGALVRNWPAHEGAVTALAVHEGTVASADATGQIAVWNLADNAAQGAVVAHAGPVADLLFTPTGDGLLSIGDDGSLKWWTLPLTPEQALPGPADAITSVATAADGSIAVVGSTDKTVRVYDLKGESPPRTLAAETDAVTSLALSADNVITATGDATGSIHLRPVVAPAADAPAEPTLLAGHVGPVLGVAIDATGSQIASAGADGTVRLWKKPTAPQVFADAPAAATKTIVSRDGKLAATIAVSSARPAIIIRDATTGKVLRELLGHSAAISSVAFSSDGKRLISGSADQTARVWDLADPKFPQLQQLTHGAAVGAVALSPDGTQAFSGGADNAIKHWSVADGAEVRAITGHTGAITAMATAGDILFSGSADNSVRLWTLSTGAALRTVAHGATVASVAVSPDGTTLASSGAAKLVKLWTVATGAAGPVLTGHVGPVASVAFSADGALLASTSTDGVRLWSVAGVQQEFVPQVEPTPTGVGFGVSAESTSRLIVGAVDNSLRLIDGSLLRTITGHEGAVNAVAFSPDGKQLLTAGADKTARIWPLGEGAPVTLPGHTDAVTSIKVNAKAGLIATASADKTVRTWQLADGKPGMVITLAAIMRDVQFSASGERLAGCGDDNSTHVWDVATGRELEQIPQGAMAIHTVAFADEQTVVSGGLDKMLHIAPIHAQRVVAAAEGPLTDLAQSADGAKIAVISAGGAITMLNAAGEVQEPARTAAASTRLALSGDGLQLTAAGAGGKVMRWNLAADQAAAAPLTIEVGEPIHALSFNGPADRLAMACEKGLRTYDPADGRLLELSPTAAPATDVIFSTDGQALIHTEANNGVLQNLSLLQLLPGHEGAVTSVSFAAGGAQLLSGGVDKTVRLWNLETGAQTPAVFAGPAEPVTAVAVSVAAENAPAFAVAASEDGKAYRWVLPATVPAAITLEAAAVYEHAAPVRSVSITPGGDRIATAGDDMLAHVWDTATGRELEQFAQQPAKLNGVALSANGASVATAAADNTALAITIAAQEIRVLENAVAHDLSFDATGQLAAASSDGKVRLWNAAGEPAKPLESGQPGALVRFAFRPQAMQAAALDVQGRVVIWNLETGEAAATIAPPEGATPAPAEAALPRGLSYSADGKRMAVTSLDGRIRVYDAEQATLLETFSPADGARFVAASYSPDNVSIIAGADSDADNASLIKVSALQVFAGHEGAVTSLAFSANGQQLFSGGADKTVRRFALADGAEQLVYGGAAEAITDISVSANSALVAATSLDKAVHVWPFERPAEADAAAPVAPQYSLPGDTPQRGLNFSNDSTKLAACADDGVVRVWDLATQQQLERFEGHEGAVNAVDFAPDNKTVVSAGQDQTARLWTTSVVRLIVASEGPVKDMSLVAAGAQAATIGVENEVRLWTLANGAMVRAYPSEESPLATLAARADNAQLAAADEEGKLFLWTLANGEMVTSFKAPAVINELRYSPDNLKLAAASADGALRYFNPADGELLYELTSPSPLTSVAFTADNRRTATVSEAGELAMWAYASPDPIRQFTGHGGSVFSVAYHPSRAQIASASGDQTIRLWNVDTGAQIRSLTGHVGAVYCVAFSPDGSLLVSCGADKTVRLWDVIGGRQLKSIDLGAQAAYSVQFHPDGKRVVAAGLDKQMHLYDALTGALQSSISGHEDFIYRAVFNKAGDKILSCGYGGNVGVWNLANGQQLFNARPARSAAFIEYAPEGAKAAMAAGDGAVYVLDLPAAAR